MPRMVRMMKFLDGNPLMTQIFQEALEKIDNQQPLTSSERVVLNELVTRAEARLFEIAIEDEGLLENQLYVPESTEKKALIEEARVLRQALRRREVLENGD